MKAIEKNKKILDEKGFIFLDVENRPYLCRIWEGEPWLFYWHCENHWVSYRKVNQNDIDLFPRNLTKEEQEIYHELHRRWERK